MAHPPSYLDRAGEFGVGSERERERDESSIGEIAIRPWKRRERERKAQIDIARVGGSILEWRQRGRERVCAKLT